MLCGDASKDDLTIVRRVSLQVLGCAALMEFHSSSPFLLDINDVTMILSPGFMNRVHTAAKDRNFTMRTPLLPTTHICTTRVHATCVHASCAHLCHATRVINRIEITFNLLSIGVLTTWEPALVRSCLYQTPVHSLSGRESRKPLVVEPSYFEEYKYSATSLSPAFHGSLCDSNMYFATSLLHHNSPILLGIFTLVLLSGTQKSL